MRSIDVIKKLQEVTTEKGKFEVQNELAGIAAHELNQPLTSIISYSELLMGETSEDSDIYQTLKVIAEEATRMMGIVKKIALATKYDTQKHISDTKIIDIEKE